MAIWNKTNKLNLQQPPVHKTPPPRDSSYTAQGIIGPDTSNEMGSSIAVPVREVVPELVSPSQRTITYGRMKNDTTVSVSMRAGKTPIEGAEFFMDPYSDDPNDLLVNEFCYDNLFGGMSSPFANSLIDILEMFEDGYSTLEEVFETRQWAPHTAGANAKTYTMLKKLGVRPANTISKILYDDNGGPMSVTQQAIQADGKTIEVIIPIDKLMIFTFQRKGGDLTGKSLLRTAYPNWYYKTHMYKIDAIQKERHGLGVPKMKLLAGYTPKDKESAITLVKNLRTNEEAGMVLPPNLDMEFAELHGNLVNVMDSANHHNAMILLNVMVQFMLLGVEGSGGGRATGAVQSDIFMKSMRYIASLICDVINMYLVPKLVVYNFKTTNYPKLKVRNIGEMRDLQMLGAALSNLAAQSVVTMDDATEQWVRQVFDMPAKQTPRPTVTQPNQSNQPNGQPNQPKGNVKGDRQGNMGKPPSGPA